MEKQKKGTDRCAACAFFVNSAWIYKIFVSALLGVQNRASFSKLLLHPL